MSNFEATKELKQGPDGINIEPWPNPKPLSVERVNVRTPKGRRHRLIVPINRRIHQECEAAS